MQEYLCFYSWASRLRVITEEVGFPIRGNVELDVNCALAIDIAI